MIEILTEQINDVMEEIPETRDSDIRLAIEVWKKYYPQYITLVDGVESIRLKSLYDLPNQDTIKRLRALIQNRDGRLLPTTWEVAKQRRFKKEVWESAMILEKSFSRTLDLRH